MSRGITEPTSREGHAKKARLVFYGDSFVFDQVSGHFYRLNATAAFVLRRVQEGLDPETLPEEMERHFNINHETAVRDSELFLNELSMLGLLEDAAA